MGQCPNIALISHFNFSPVWLNFCIFKERTKFKKNNCGGVLNKRREDSVILVVYRKMLRIYIQREVNLSIYSENQAKKMWKSRKIFMQCIYVLNVRPPNTPTHMHTNLIITLLDSDCVCFLINGFYWFEY